MTRTLAVLIPVLERPHRAQPLLESLHASVSPEVAEVRPVFICSPHDTAEQDAVRATGADPLITPFPLARSDYPRKMNYAASVAPEEWLFLAADDLRFNPGWFQKCLAVHQRTGACVIGTNDLGNRRVIAGHHSTHTLVHRDYLECGTIDEPGLLFHPGYDHCFSDDEMIQTAKHRGTFQMARDAIVEHLHPDWAKGTVDATYERGQERFWQDKELFEERQYLWLRGARPGHPSTWT